MDESIFYKVISAVSLLTKEKLDTHIRSYTPDPRVKVNLVARITSRNAVAVITYNDKILGVNIDIYSADGKISISSFSTGWLSAMSIKRAMPTEEQLVKWVDRTAARISEFLDTRVKSEESNEDSQQSLLYDALKYLGLKKEFKNFAVSFDRCVYHEADAVRTVETIYIVSDFSSASIQFTEGDPGVVIMSHSRRLNADYLKSFSVGFRDIFISQPDQKTTKLTKENYKQIIDDNLEIMKKNDEQKLKNRCSCSSL